MPSARSGGAGIKVVILANPGDINTEISAVELRFCKIVMLRFLEKLLWHDVICSY